MNLVKTLLRPVAAGLLATMALAAAAQEPWPAKPLRVIVPFAPGGNAETIMRLIQPALEQSLGQPVIIDNKPGAGGTLGMQEVVAARDGHTILAGVDTMLTINPYVYRKLRFKPADDFVPVTTLATFSQMLVCHPGVHAKTVQDLLALARKQDMSYASGGAGVPGHMAMELLLASTKVRMTHVPYRGPSPAVQDILGGNVPCGFLTSPVVGPFVREGKLVALAVSGNRRLAGYPNVPTIAESGVKGYDATFGEIVAAPRGTPASVVQRLNREIVKNLALPELRARLAALDLDVVGDTPEAAAERIQADSRKWGEIAGHIGLQVD